MSIAVGDVDTLMPYPFCDCQSGKSHVNQQADMAVSQIVYANAFYPGFFTAPIHLTVEIVFTDGENAAVRFHTIELFEVVLYLVAQNWGIWMIRLLLGVLGVVMTSCLLRR